MARLEDMPPIDRAAKHVDKMGYLTVCGIAPAFKGQLTWFDVQQTAQYISRLTDVANWCLADILRWCWDREDDTDSKLSLVRQVLAMAQVDMKGAEMLSYIKASRLWDWEYRQSDDVLSFHHHLVVADKPREIREYYLKMARNSNWSVHDLKREMYHDHQRTPD